MTRLIILVLLLTGRLVRGVTEDIVTSRAGSVVELKVESVGRAFKCVLETNRREKLEYTPGHHRIREDIDTLDEKNGTCTFGINKANGTHAGVWKVTAYTAGKETEENIDSFDDITPEVFLFRLYIRQEKAAIPSQYIEVYDGHYVNMKYDENYKNLTACNLTGPKMESVNLLTEKRNNFQLLGQCGVRMKVNATYEGSWELTAVVNNYTLYYTLFNIDVYQLEQEDPNDMLVLQWTRGSPGIISLSGKSKICQIVDPNGVTVATSVGKCYHQVKVATVQHEGVWLARYNMYGMLEPIEQKFRIATFDRVIFNANVTRSENGNTRLFCQLEIKDTRPESCSFIRPDGTRLYMTPVIGTERYTAYVYSFTKRERAYNVLECAITIMELEDVDYGAWRCDLKIYSSRSYGTVLRVDYPDSRGNNNTKGEMIKIRTDDVYVKRGDPFTIKCIADAALKYCWLRSPNGTSYSVTEDTKIESPIILHYQGNGLSFGECGVEISAAVHSDDGRWSCLMGMVDGGEQAATMSVTVTETYLVAEQTEIAVSARNDPVLSCHILPRMLDRTVHYCRWIRPDGYGIYNDISHRYTTNSSYSDCRLVILNYYPEEDDGNWTCVAGLVGKNGHLEEAWDNVMCHEIPYASSMTVFIVKRLSFVVIGITLIVVVFGTLSYVWGRYRLRRMMSRGIINGSPSYSPHVYYPSKSLQPKFDI
ncbi:hypothetical protein ACFW04_005097 [Cataglyphis niger]